MLQPWPDCRNPLYCARVQAELEYVSQQAGRLQSVVERYGLATADMAVLTARQEGTLRHTISGVGGTQQLMARLVTVEGCVHGSGAERLGWRVGLCQCSLACCAPWGRVHEHSVRCACFVLAMKRPPCTVRCALLV